MHRVKTMRITQKISGRFGRTANPGEFRQAVRLNVQFKTGMHQCATDGVVPTTCAERRNRAFIILLGEAQFIFGNGRVAKSWFYVRHLFFFLRLLILFLLRLLAPVLQ